MHPDIPAQYNRNAIYLLYEMVWGLVYDRYRTYSKSL
jgi:hypothetical protein